MSEVVLALDTNFLQAILDSARIHHGNAIDVLVQYANAKLVICGMVFSEALCMPDISLSELELSLNDFAIEVEWYLSEQVWKEAGLARATQLRHRNPNSSKRVIADFIIGAHANTQKYWLCTFDSKGFRMAFPSLVLHP